MSAAPSQLSPERIDAMISRVAEACMEGVEEARGHMAAAQDVVAFERASRAFNGVCRNLRQAIAIKQRFDREQLALERARAEDGRAAEREARRAHESALATHRKRVDTRITAMVWDEYEQDEALDCLDGLDAELDDLAAEPGFLETPVETLVQALADRLGVTGEPGPAQEATADAPRQVPTARPSTTLAAPPAPPADPPRPPPPDAAPAGPDPPPAAEAAADAPPPDPAPEPYLPPWERLSPGQSLGGGSGW